MVTPDNSVSEKATDIKYRGKIFTPDRLANQILDMGHYTTGNIRKKHVIDNSCGNGQFLIWIVDRYCREFTENPDEKANLKHELETYIHGIEIDKEDLEICRQRCSAVAGLYGINDKINWDFINADALETEKYNGKMDFVMGNPPYVRVHNLQSHSEKIKSFSFSDSGMTDIFITFYEIGINMLGQNGILCYITPSSFFTSLAGKKLRGFLTQNKIIESVCDLKHHQPFSAAVYTAIVCLNMQKTQFVNYYEYNADKAEPEFCEKLSYDDFETNHAFYFAPKKSLELLKKILLTKNISDISVKNGYATLADKIFIKNFNFESQFIIPVVKASKGTFGKIIFPYDSYGNPYEEETIKKDNDLYAYLLSKKSDLDKRSTEKQCKKYWYIFGRCQAINDTFRNKLAVNSLIRTYTDLKLTEAKTGCGVYGGLYAVSDTVSTEEIKKALYSEEFSEYIALLGKYKSGGYYTFSSKDVKHYLDYKLGKEVTVHDQRQ